jgi:hypothetical protein
MTLFLAVPALHAGDDPHFDGTMAELLEHCPFAHGYLHGYEDGFHLADADFHLGRSRGSKALLQMRATDGYRSGFGDHASFRNGYRQGLLAGYADSISGRDFRAYVDLRYYKPGAESLHFPDVDTGYSIGYELGFRKGSQSVSTDADFDAEPAPCPARSSSDGSLPPSSRAFCDGFGNAYAIGYRDAYLSGEELTTAVTARK